MKNERKEYKKAVFISVPMHGLDEALIKRQIQLAKRAYCRRAGVSAKDIWFYDNLSYSKEFEKIYREGIVLDNCPRPRLMYLSSAICGLSYCDEAVFGRGWKEANGCCIEHEICERYGIPIDDLETRLTVKVDPKTKEMTKVKK